MKVSVTFPAETRAALHDGRTIRIRPIRPDDAERLSAFHSRLSVKTVRLRFFGPMKSLSPDFASRLSDVDFVRRCAFVVSLPGDDAIHAVGRYEGESRRSAELAFVVEDSFQGLGVGALLLDRLVEHGRAVGYHRFTAAVLCENSAMLGLFRECRYSPDIHVHGTTAFVKLDIREAAGATGSPAPG